MWAAGHPGGKKAVDSTLPPVRSGAVLTRPIPEPLAICSWAVLALIVLAVGLTLYLTTYLEGPPLPAIFMAAIRIALLLCAMLLLPLFVVLLIVRVRADSAQPTPRPCNHCGFIIPLADTTAPAICHQCRARQHSGSPPRDQQANGLWVMLALLVSVGAFAGFILPVSAGADSGMSYWITVPLMIAATTVGLPVVFFLCLVLLSSVRARRFSVSRSFSRAPAGLPVKRAKW